MKGRSIANILFRSPVSRAVVIVICITLLALAAAGLAAMRLYRASEVQHAIQTWSETEQQQLAQLEDAVTKLEKIKNNNAKQNARAAQSPQP